MEEKLSQDRIREIIREELLNMLGDYSKIPLEVENAFLARGFKKTLSTTGASSTVYVAATSGGAVTTAITFVNGIRTS